MLPCFHKKNWQLIEISDEQSDWQYVHPETIEQKQAEVRKAIEERGLLRYFPFRCRHVLDGKEIIDERALLEILKFAAGPMDRWSKDDSYLMGGPWTPRCGAAAVAIVKFDDWLSHNSEWKAQCEEWLIRACLSTKPKLRPEPSLGDTCWSSFCAEALPRLWVRKPGHEDLRRCMAYLTAAPHQDARRLFFATLARKRSEYADDFGRLLHLAVWVARLVVLDPGPLPQHKASGRGENVEKVFLRLAEDFVHRRLTPLPGDWATISDERPKDLKPNPYGELDGFDGHILVQSFAWLGEEASDYLKARDRDFLRSLVEGLASTVPRRLLQSEDEEEKWARLRVDPESLLRPVRLDQRPLIKAIQQPERQSGLSAFVSRIKQCADDVLAKIRKAGRSLQNQAPPRLSATPPRRRHTLGTPWQSDYDIADIVTLFLVREPDAAARRKLWEPWLGLGEPCHYWVRLLLNKIYLAANHVRKQDSVFCELMRDIFEHALAEGGWLDGRNRRVHRSSDIARAFLGLGDFVESEFWSADRAYAAVALRDYWPRWADVAIPWYGCAATFIRLLRKPAMKPLRPLSLQWLVRSDPDHWLSDKEASIALVRLLELVWQERHDHGRELTGSLRDVFERLLQALVGRHVADAVSLSGLIAREN